MLECKVCGCKFNATEERHYIARDNAVNGSFFGTSEPKIYDAYDCPSCGSQIVVKERKRTASPDELWDLGEDTDEEEQEED